MSQKRKNFIVNNTAFVCQNCGTENPPAPQTCRNHCRKCLFSLHVDAHIPGDRASVCLGLMQPMEVGQDGKKGFFVIHKCTKCGKEIRNKLADDDDWEAVIQLTSKLSH